jgi:hypothetical protein
MDETSGRLQEAQREIGPKIQARLADITSPDYEDPARRDLTALDWFALVGFLAACAVGFTIWGY